MPKQIKVIRSHTGLARFYPELSRTPRREIARIASIPSPYAYSPTHTVWQWGNREVIIVETSHKVYRVFEA